MMRTPVPSSVRLCTIRARALARKRERGAVVFVVTMAILLLSALGVWSMHAAGLVSRASGFGRAAAQTQFMAEMGVMSATGYLNLPGMADANVQLGRKADTCESVRPGEFCKSILLEDVNLEIDDLTGNSLTDLAAEGSFGPYANELQGDFRVEVTEPNRAYLPGQSLDDSTLLYYRVVLTSYGLLRPYAGVIENGNICAADSVEFDAENSTAGRLGMRAHAIIGPVYSTP